MNEELERQIMDDLSGLVAEVLGDAFDGEIEFSPELSLLYDLGLESVEFIALLDCLHTRYGFPIETVVRATAAGTTLGDVRVGDLLAFIAKEGRRPNLDGASERRES